MKRIHVLSAVLLLAVGASAPADDLAALQKAWFGSTKPGSWVKYEQTQTDPKGKVQKSELTLSRLAGEGDRVWFEMRIVPREGARSDRECRHPSPRRGHSQHFASRLRYPRDEGKRQRCRAVPVC